MAIDFLQFIKKSYNWADWKSISQIKKFIIQYDQDDLQYTIYGYDGPEVHICIIWLSEVPWAIKEEYSQEQNDLDKTDFETNYKNSSNKTTVLQQKPFADALGFRARLKGFSGTATAGQTTNIDYKITEERYINGTQVMLLNSTFGDTIKFQVVDKDNILGYGAGAVLDEFASSWNVTSDEQDQGVYVLSYPAKIIANLYIRLVYISIGESDVSVRVNLFLHKKT